MMDIDPTKALQAAIRIGFDEAKAQAADEIEKLRAALREAIEMIEFWAAYASPYFQEKHDLADDLEKLLAVLGEKE